MVRKGNLAVFEGNRKVVKFLKLKVNGSVN